MNIKVFYIPAFTFKKIVVLLITASILTFGTAQTKVSAQTVNLDPELLKQFNFVTEDGQVLVEVSMQALLTLALERATTIDILAIDREIASENYLAAKEMYNPSLSTSVGVQRSLTATGTNISGSSSTSFLSLQAQDTSSLSATWSKKITNGISYSVGYTKASSQTNTGEKVEEDDSFSGWDKSDDPLYSDQVTASVSIPIFQDWGDINNAPEYKSRIGLETAGYQSQKTILELLKLVAGIYWDLVGVEKNILSLQASEALSRQFVSDTKIKMELGVLDPIEVKQGESQLLTVQQSLLTENFKKKQIEDQIKVALNLQDLPYGYRATEKMAQRKQDFDFDVLLKQVYENSQDLALLQSQLKLNGIQLKEAHNKAKTDLDFSVEYQLYGYGKSVADAASSLGESGYNDYQVGLTWNIPLFDKQTPKEIRQRNLENSKLLLQISDLKAQLKVTLQSIIRNLKLAEQGIKLATTSVELAKDLLEKETEKFNLGNSTSFRVSQVQQDLTDAEKNKTISEVNYEKSYLELLIVTGKIFAEYSLPSVE
ncbi:MAG: TolC family protein [Proteobacteria bacterium]|nr:TolC family protein [Pseudomonadota bacterium]